MNLPAALFQAERIKWRRSWVFVAAVLPPICQVCFLLLLFWFSEIQADQLGPGYQVWYQINHAAWNVIFMPITVALVTLLSWDQEETAGAWKHLLIQPIPHRDHYLTKLISHAALLFIAQTAFSATLILTSLVLNYHASYLSMGPQRLDLAIRLSAYSFLAALPLVAFHTWLSTRLRGVGLTLTIALAGSLLTVLTMVKSPLARWLPWSLASQGVMFGANGVGGAWGSLLIALFLASLFLTLGFIDFSHRDELR